MEVLAAFLTLLIHQLWRLLLFGGNSSLVYMFRATLLISVTHFLPLGLQLLETKSQEVL